MNKWFLILLLLTYEPFFGQSDSFNGLDFSYKNRKFESRTSLNLATFSDLAFKDKLLISFELSINKADEYGTILNISGDPNLVRLLYSPQKDSSCFKIIVNNKPAKSKIVRENGFFNRGNWITLNLIVDLLNKKCSLSLGNEKVETEITKIPIGDPEIIFGAFTERNEPFLDIASFRIRNVKIYRANGELKHLWKLDEAEGETAKDLVSNLDASVSQPDWMINSHYKFRNIARIGPFRGADLEIMPAFTYDRNGNRLIIVGNSFAYYFDLSKRVAIKEYYKTPLYQVAYSAVFDEKKGKLFAMYCGGGMVAEYDQNKKNWIGLDSSLHHKGQYYGSSIFINPLTNDLCMLGGYGYYLTKNDLQKYDFSLKKWIKLKTKGDHILPFTAAMMGKKNEKGDFYLYGGQGNESGKQEEGHRRLTNLYLLRMKDTSFIKIGDIGNKSGAILSPPALLSDSLNNQLLFMGSSEFNENEISFRIFNYDFTGKKFNAMSESFESFYHFRPPLYYDSENNEFVTLQAKKEGKDSLYIYIKSLSSPLLTENQYSNLLKPKFSWKFLAKNDFILIVLLMISVVPIYYYIRKKNRKPLNTEAFSSDHNIAEPTSNSIYLFGNFRVIDKNSKDIAKEFSPKIKQLFIILLMKSYNGSSSGISTDALTTYLWPEASNESAKNNRNVSLNKLRSILSKLDTVEIKVDHNIFELSISENIYCDYVFYQSIMNRNGDLINRVAKVKEILSRGELLNGEGYDWVDGQKAHIIEDSISKLKKILLSGSTDPESRIDIADSLLLLDSVNEFGLSEKIKALVEIGHHSQAKITFDLYAKEYHRLYAEKYQKSFSDFLN